MRERERERERERDGPGAPFPNLCIHLPSELSYSTATMALLMVLLGLAVVLLLLCSGLLLRWNEVRYRREGLPPGTMGWPLFGETTEFLKQGPSFMKNQRLRYGSLFKTHFLGCPTVVSMDPELNRFILMNEGKGFVPGYPQSMLDILGKCNIAAIHGPLHKAMRSAMLGLINPQMIRDQLLPKIDQFMRSHLADWSGKVIDIQEKTKEMALLSALKQIASIEAGPLSDALKSEIFKLVLGTLSLPINLPGTNYRRGFQARQKLVGMLGQVIDERRTCGCLNSDMLDSLLNAEDRTKGRLSDEQIIDLIIALVYSGYETVSTTSMMAVKYLHDHPRVLEELRNEHFLIRKRKLPEDAIDWNDYKFMTFTRAVILETLRIATIVNGVLRKTTQDTEMKGEFQKQGTMRIKNYAATNHGLLMYSKIHSGFVIPKGWKIYVYTREINYDPYMYPEPLAFNPWRWLENSRETNQHFMMFGGGSRLCPGKELGMVEIATFLHYFVTTYRWEEIGGDRILKFPRVEAPNGLRIGVDQYIKI